MIEPQGKALRALARICRRLGGQLILASRRTFDEQTDADDAICMPFTAGSRYEYGVHWGRKTIYAVSNTTHIGFVIHEAGHVFADRHHPDDDKCDEWAWLGWEIAVARRIGVMRAWSNQNGSYGMGKGIDGGIGSGKDWEQLSAKERQLIIADRLAHAQTIGVLGADGSPRSVR